MHALQQSFHPMYFGKWLTCYAWILDYTYLKNTIDNLYPQTGITGDSIHTGITADVNILYAIIPRLKKQLDSRYFQLCCMSDLLSQIWYPVKFDLKFTTSMQCPESYNGLCKHWNQHIYNAAALRSVGLQYQCGETPPACIPACVDSRDFSVGNPAWGNVMDHFTGDFSVGR